MKLIGVTGRAGSGKDTVADYLCKHHGFYKYSFAAPLKEMLKVIGVFDDRATKELPHPVFGVSPRRMMQTLGTDWGRDTICDDIWLRVAEQRLRGGATIVLNSYQYMGNEISDVGPAKGMVISDVRFENEAAWVRRQGGLLIHLVRPGLAAVEAHASEAGIVEVGGDAYIENDGTIEELHRKVYAVLP
jgi:hypothetical protein